MQNLISEAVLIKKQQQEKSKNSNLKKTKKLASLILDLNLDQHYLELANYFFLLEETELSDSQKTKLSLLTKDQIPIHAVSLFLDFKKKRTEVSNILNLVNEENIKKEETKSLVLDLFSNLKMFTFYLCTLVLQLQELKKSDITKTKKIATLAFNVYISLANRLGLNQIKWHLEDLCFYILNKNIYQDIANFLAQKRGVREEFITSTIDKLKQDLARLNLNETITGRPKHIYSIYKKMRKKNLGFKNLYDINAFRILVNTIDDAYLVLSFLQNKYKTLDCEFDDYIANPKINGYRSLHLVIVIFDKFIEVQIRTHLMHKTAQIGIAAHWAYKENTNLKQNIYSLEDNFSNKRINALTPKGDVVSVPKNSTVLDFAYYIHSDLGHKTICAKVNNKIVPFSYQIKTAQIIELITKQSSKPNFDWLNKNPSYLNSKRARIKVLSFLKKEKKQELLTLGKNNLDKILKDLQVSNKILSDSLEKLKFSTLDDLYLSLGTGQITSEKLKKSLEKITNKNNNLLKNKINNQFSTLTTTYKQDIIIADESSYLTSLAKCCMPLPGDKILAFITLNKGFSIHLKNCLNVKKLATQKILKASWNLNIKDLYEVKIAISMQFSDKNILKIENLLILNRIYFKDIGFNKSKKQDNTLVFITIFINNKLSLERLTQKIASLKFVFNVFRTKN